MNIKTILAVLFVLLLWPLKMPQGEDYKDFEAESEWLASYMKRHTNEVAPCSQVFRIVRVAHLDSVYVQRPRYSHNLTRVLFPDDTALYHWEHIIRYSYDSVLVRDTVVYVGGE